MEGVKEEEGKAKPGEYLTGAKLAFSGRFVAGSTKVGQPSAVNSEQFTVGTEDTEILSAKADEGAGSWVYGLGTGESGAENKVLSKNNKAYQENGGDALEVDAVSKKSPITLEIPGSSAKRAAEYTTNLIWTLSEVPTN